MAELKKDMLLVVKDPIAESYNNRTMLEVNQLLHNVDVVKLDDLKKPRFIDVSGIEIDPEVDKAYLRAKYFDEPNVYYEATFDSINRMNRERFNMFKHVAHILGATMITKMNVHEEEKNYGFAAQVGFGIERVSEINNQINGNVKGKMKSVDVNASVNRGSEFSSKSEKTFNTSIQALIAQKLDRGYLQYEVFESKEFNKERWEIAKELLQNSGLYYNEDFRNLLESRNPDNGLKKFDFVQYQISSDLNKYLTLAAAIDFSNIISGATATAISAGAAAVVSGGVAKVLSGILGVNIGLDVDVKTQIQNFKRESDLLVIGFEHSDSCLDELDKIIEQYKKTRALFGDGRLEKNSIAEQLIEKGLSLGEISTIAKLPIDEVDKIRERMEKNYQNKLDKK